MTISEWNHKRLGDIAETTSGGTPDRKNQAFFGGSIPWVKSGELEDTFINDTEEKLTPGGLKHSAAKLFPSGTLLIAMYGATVGKTAVLKIEAATNQAVCAIFPKANHTGPDFLRYALVYQRPEILKLRYGGAQPNISQQVIRNLVVPIPPLAEQRNIAAVLALAQRALEEQKRLIALTAELKEALLHRLFTQGVRGEPQRQTEIGLVPESWRVTRLDDFCILQRGFDIIKKDQAAGDVPVVSSGGVASYHNVAKVKGPGVVVGRKGTLGKVHYIEGDYWPHDTTLWVKDFKGHDPLFTSYFLKTLRFERYNSGASNPTLNRNTVHAEVVAYPQINEQEDIGRILKMVDDKAQHHQHKHAALTALFHTLLHQLMTAQLRVHNLDLSGLGAIKG